VYQDEYTASGAAIPILRQGQGAGCFVILSAQPHFFTAHALTILQRYCELTAVAMRDDEWYAPEQFALHAMPSASTQQAYIARFFDRVSMLCKNPADGSLANYLDAERTVSQQIEAELVSLVSQE
jgi:hypothetical protein